MQNVVSEDSIERAFGGASVGGGAAASVFAGAVSNCASSGWSPEDFVGVMEAYARCFGLGATSKVEGVDAGHGGGEDGDGGRWSPSVQVLGRKVVGTVFRGGLDLPQAVDGAGNAGGGCGDVPVGAPGVRSEVRSGVEDVPKVDGNSEASAVPVLVPGRHHARNRVKREKQKKFKQQWRAGEGVGVSSEGSTVGSVKTVDTRTGVEIEAAQTLAARRVEENKVKIAEAKVAAKLAEHRLKALNDKERSLVIDRLAAARLEEKINTSRKRSQASFKECGSPIDSVGSALSAHEFAFKQQVRQIDAEKKKVAYMKVQLDRYYAYSPDYVNQIIAEIPEPHIPTEQEMEEEDSDQSPFLSNDEMWEEANKYQHG